MERLNIPDEIHVGFQKRTGTYTGQLAYVIYKDAKGKLRKQVSWENWRHKNIDPQVFENKPTEGFVLNKGVGGARNSWGWNPRNEYIRVFDPRGFEFEISVANLLFILQVSNSYKGKGLEGEFVYSWDGKELVLLPVDCVEYKMSSDFTEMQTKKVTKADMVEGHQYLTKKGDEVTYLGRIKCKKYSSRYNQTRELLKSTETKLFHVFKNNTKKYDLDDHMRETGFTKLAEKLPSGLDPKFADKYTDFINDKYVSPLKEISFETLGKSFADSLAVNPHNCYSAVSKVSSCNTFVLTLQDRSFPVAISHHSYHRKNRPRTQSEIVLESHGLDMQPTIEATLLSGNRRFGRRTIYLTVKEVIPFILEGKLTLPLYKLESGKTIPYTNY